MRAWELYETDDLEKFDDPTEQPMDRRTPLISLRQINILKKIKASRRKEFEQRKILMGLIYGVVDENEPTAIQQKQDQIDLSNKVLKYAMNN